MDIRELLDYLVEIGATDKESVRLSEENENEHDEDWGFSCNRCTYLK